MRKKIAILVLLLTILSLTACGEKVKTAKLDPDNPTAITVWQYYNGKQQEAFESLVNKFNQTDGKEMGIVVDSASQGTVQDLEKNVLAAYKKEPGAGEIPDVFAAYSDTAYTADQLGVVANLAPYFSEKDLEQYIPEYIEEGYFSGGVELKIFPIVKSTEIFAINQTDWNKFASAVGASLRDLQTTEGITKTAQKYYEWTDSLTPKKNDGKAFFGRDALGNYFIIGAKQLGTELFSIKDGKPVLDFNKNTIRTLWDNYYIPYIKGYFAEVGRFRSDDIKTGDIISCICSASSASFLPKQVILDDETSYSIKMKGYKAPKFKNGENYSVLQGAGMAVTNSDDQHVYASVQFLKWLTKPENNVTFTLNSGYLPVTKEGLSDAKEEIQKGDDFITTEVVNAAINTIENDSLYTVSPFQNGTAARDVLNVCMSDQAASDRKVVKNRLASGMTLEKASATFTTDEHFETWYNQTKAQLEKLMK